MHTWQPTYQALDQATVDLMLEQEWVTPEEMHQFLEGELAGPALTRLQGLLLLVTLELTPSTPVQ
jgi:hypothetical protein